MIWIGAVWDATALVVLSVVLGFVPMMVAGLTMQKMPYAKWQDTLSHWIWAISSGLIFLMLWGGPANAQACTDRAALVERLTETYGERFAGAGMQNERAIFEIWVSDETGTWTIIMSRPNGQSCVMAAGENWRGDSSRPVGEEG